MTVDLWPCGCAKGMTPHGAGWGDCGFSDEQKAIWLRAAQSAALPVAADGEQEA